MHFELDQIRRFCQGLYADFAHVVVHPRDAPNHANLPGMRGVETDCEQFADLDPFTFFALEDTPSPESLRSNNGHCSALRSRPPCDALRYRRFGAFGDEAVELDVENFFSS
jgi:hypothetical protein